LKLANLLYTNQGILKLADFGLAREVFPSNHYRYTPASSSSCIKPLTEKVMTLWYRAPELLLGCYEPYTSAIDMWATGCILAELIIRKPLLPAGSEEEQLNMITKLLGNPSSKLVNKIDNEKNKEFVQQLPKREGKDFN
jgi:serine/threonine protein kinase